MCQDSVSQFQVLGWSQDLGTSHDRRGTDGVQRGSVCRQARGEGRTGCDVDPSTVRLEREERGREGRSPCLECVVTGDGPERFVNGLGDIDLLVT